jgi:diaminopimelate epimerase
MEIAFYKYQGTGNDFVMIDDRSCFLNAQDTSWIQQLCHRRFGIGSDGLIILRNHEKYDFHMHYFNADGSQSMCGNGARCAVAFASFMGMVEDKAHFLAIDGPHLSIIKNGLVELKMGDVEIIEKLDKDWYVDTGSPHHIRFVDKVKDYPVVKEGAEVRYSENYPEGTNVNFVEIISENVIAVRTYERGVENETLSCGTGVTACALVHGNLSGSNEIEIRTMGGDLKVNFNPEPNGKITNIWLIGPAEQVFSGKVDLQKIARFQEKNGIIIG